MVVSAAAAPGTLAQVLYELLADVQEGAVLPLSALRVVVVVRAETKQSKYVYLLTQGDTAVGGQ